MNRAYAAFCLLLGLGFESACVHKVADAQPDAAVSPMTAPTGTTDNVADGGSAAGDAGGTALSLCPNAATADQWSERILDDNGAIDWAQYEAVASNASTVDVRDYLLGPKYGCYHPTPETFPTLGLWGDADGWNGPAAGKPSPNNPGWWSYKQAGWGWYTQAGQLLYSADDATNAGVLSSAIGESYDYQSGVTPGLGEWGKAYWENKSPQNYYAWPTPPELSQPNLGNPKQAIAVTTTRGISPEKQYVAFQNGLIVTFSVDACDFVHKFGCGAVGNFTTTGNIYPSVQLPAGKVPMALTETSAGEFVIAAVWDTTNHKGQLAVMAVQGTVRGSQTNPNDWNSEMETGVHMYGFPSWPTTQGMKLLGFVDLPIAAPTSLEAGTDLGWTFTSRDMTSTNLNIDTALDNQSERDTWYNAVTPNVFPNFKATAHAGYVVVASRSENKVVLVDLGPLLQYYRTMYFTTQANYDETKTLGAADGQWPYTFAYAPSQTPVVKYTIDVPSPTSVAAGLDPGMCSTKNASCNPGWNSWLDWRNSANAFGAGYAYVGTMDGHLLMYTTGNLNVAGKASTAPTLYKTISIGRNPTSIEHGNGGMHLNDFWINTRGDKEIYSFDAAGNQLYVLKDSRMVDPVMAEPSANWASTFPVHVMDFTGKTVLTYVLAKQDFSVPMTFGAKSDTVPGYPFAFQQNEVP